MWLDITDNSAFSPFSFRSDCAAIPWTLNFDIRDFSYTKETTRDDVRWILESLTASEARCCFLWHVFHRPFHWWSRLDKHRRMEANFRSSSPKNVSPRHFAAEKFGRAENKWHQQRTRRTGESTIAGVELEERVAPTSSKRFESVIRMADDLKWSWWW